MEKSVNKVFNEQITMEFYSAKLYLQMSEWLLEHGWVGASHWFDIQYQEEVAHAFGLIRWLRSQDGQVRYEAIEAPKSDFASLLDIFKEALAHEKEITASIKNMVKVARAADDQSSEIFLNWYIMEQAEEEENQRDNILGVERCKECQAALLEFDEYLGKREFHIPAIPYLG